MIDVLGLRGKLNEADVASASVVLQSWLVQVCV